MIHYHIRWADSKLDWEAFQTEEQARATAEELKRPGEKYAIEKRDGDCQRCNQIKTGYSHMRAKERTGGIDEKPCCGTRSEAVRAH